MYIPVRADHGNSPATTSFGSISICSLRGRYSWTLQYFWMALCNLDLSAVIAFLKLDRCLLDAIR